jgi:electron transport complex protein RnfB
MRCVDPLVRGNGGPDRLFRARVRVSAPDCTGCGACLRTCPERALRPVAVPGASLLLVTGACTGCLECVEVCPADAISEAP